MNRFASHVCAAFLLALLAPISGTAEPASHPLDALTFQEYWTVLETMKASGKLDAASCFAGISLHEPPKEEVLRWKAGDVFRREALAIVKQGRRTFEAVVDATNRKLVSWTEKQGVEPVLIADETEGITGRLKADPQWQAAMRKRGITDFDTVDCDGDSPGYFGTPEEKGRRLQRVRCSEGKGVADSGGHPIEGLIVVWDSEEGKIIRVIDTGVVPVPPQRTDYSQQRFLISPTWTTAPMPFLRAKFRDRLP